MSLDDKDSKPQTEIDELTEYYLDGFSTFGGLLINRLARHMSPEDAQQLQRDFEEYSRVFADHRGNISIDEIAELLPNNTYLKIFLTLKEEEPPPLDPKKEEEMRKAILDKWEKIKDKKQVILTKNNKPPPFFSN